MRTKHQSDNLLARFPVFLRTLEEKKDSEKFSSLVKGDSFLYENNQNSFRAKMAQNLPEKLCLCEARFSKVPKRNNNSNIVIIIIIIIIIIINNNNNTGFLSYSLYNIWKDPLYRMSGSEFYEWLFGPDTFSGLSRNVWPVVIWGDDKPVAYGQRYTYMMIWCWYMKNMYLNFRLKRSVWSWQMKQNKFKKKTARITQSSKLHFNINTWLSYISINEDNAQLTKGYYQIATISSIRSTIVASVTSRVNHRLWYSASPLCLISCCSLTPMTLISSQGWQQLSWKWDHTREGLARKRDQGQGFSIEDE